VKNISLALNIVLLLAVGFLYYKQFSGKTPETVVPTDGSDSTAVAPTPVVLSELPKDVPLVFINADSIFAKYEMAKKAKTALEAKVSTYQRSYQSKVDAFQKEYQDYMEKAGAGAYSKEQGLAIEEGLQKKRDDIMQMEQNQEKVMGEMDNSSVGVQKSIYDFLKRFNQEHGYYCAMAYTTTGGGVLGIKDSLDVTNQVLTGLNAEYKASKAK
jgi:outer membrane protein